MGLGLVEMIMALEDRFEIVITDEEAYRLATVADLYELVLAKVRPSIAPAATHLTYPDPELWQTLVAIIADELNIPAEQVTPTARLYDLERQ